MAATNSTYHRRFQELMGQLNTEVETLKNRIHSLEKKNSQLKTDLKEMEENKSDVFSSVKETDRMALKHQIKGLVSKIDEHLDEQTWKRLK